MDVKEIESAIAQLPPAKVAELAQWFEEFHARVWDAQIERDQKSGRLDSLLNEAEQDLNAGRCEPL
jgi:UTP:GlnB (protein PII) uridylyltransferase